MKEEPRELCDSLHSHEILSQSVLLKPSTDELPVKPTSYARGALASLKKELLLGSQFNYGNELMIHSGIGRGKSNAVHPNDTEKINCRSQESSESKCNQPNDSELSIGKAVPSLVPLNKQNDTLKKMDPVKESNYKKLSNGIDTSYNRDIKRKPNQKMNRFTNVSAPLPYKTFENGVFPPPPQAHFTIQQTIKHYRPREPQLYHAKQAIPTLQKSPFPSEMERIMYSKPPRPPLCPPMYDTRYYIHRNTYNNNKPELQAHVACLDPYAFSANNTYRKQPKETMASMDKKQYYNNNSNAHIKHYMKDGSSVHYSNNNKAAMNSARGPMPNVKNLPPTHTQLEKCTSSYVPCTNVVNSCGDSKHFSPGGAGFLLKCDNYPKKDLPVEGMQHHGKHVRYGTSHAERKSGNISSSNNNSNSPSVLQDWSLLCKDELAYQDGGREEYLSHGQSTPVAKMQTVCDSSSHSDFSGKKLLHSNSDLQGTSVCSSDSGIETTVSFADEKKILKLAGTIAKTAEDFPELGANTSLPTSPNYRDLVAPNRSDVALCSGVSAKSNHLPLKKRLSDDNDVDINAIEGKESSEKLVFSPDSSFPESSETIATLSNRTDSVLSDSSSICSSSNSSMFKLENARLLQGPTDVNDMPPVVIMDNFMPSEDISGISFGIEINEMLEICAKSAPNAEAKEFEEAEVGESDVDSREPELSSLEAEKNVFPIRGKMFQFKDSFVDTDRCNLADIMGFLQSSWNRVQKNSGKDAGNLTWANLCVED